MVSRELMARHVPCSDCPLRKNPLFRSFTPSELAFVEGFKMGELSIDPGTPLFIEDANAPHLYTMLRGWAFRYKTLPDGRRQILNYVLPGDLVGLQGSLFDKMEHGVEALTQALLCVFPRDRVYSLYERQAGLAFDVTWLAAREERLLDEALLSIGRRTALERVAYLTWYLFARAREVGLTKGNKLALPVTQQHFADTLGLSVVHTNKTLHRLRSEGCIVWRGRDLVIEDEAALLRVAKVEGERPQLRPFV